MIPRLYSIVDAEVLAGRGVELRAFAEGLRAAGVGLVQYRDKRGPAQAVLQGAEVLREVFAESSATLVMNDRADLAVLAGFDGVHVGQGDLSVEDARAVLRVGDPTHAIRPHEWGTRDGGSNPTPARKPQEWGTRLVGVSTHTDGQVRAAEAGCADYVAIGPVFTTGTKADAERVVGLEGVRRARALTRKPLVAIGGITRTNARSVVAAGADSVAVISGLLVAGESVEKVARDFLEILG